MVFMWDRVLANAKKILGENATIRDQKFEALGRANAQTWKMSDGLRSMQDALEKRILVLHNAVSSYRNALIQAQDDIVDSNYGLDPGKPEDKKKIEQARSLFIKYFAEETRGSLDMIQTGEELEKHIANMAKYCSQIAGGN